VGDTVLIQFWFRAVLNESIYQTTGAGAVNRVEVAPKTHTQLL